MLMKVKIRNTKPEDYKEVCDLGTKSYSENYYEGEESFTSKIKNNYEGCFVADLDGIIGYIISFPYFVGKSFPINSSYEEQENTNCWYIHDVCISEEFRGKGVAKELVKTVLGNSNSVYCLTSVMNSDSFWEKFGFRKFFELNYCGLPAKYMILIK
jgi:ribosomal protein S18 acetylase RimI-like enzyme